MMVSEMKWAVSLLCCLNGCLNVAAAAELTGARTVYLMPMGHSLDQFIANRLTRMHVLQVVTDPGKADTIFTDQVGAALEDRLKDLYPPPPEAKEEKAAPKEKPETPPPNGGRPSLLGDTVNKADKAGSMGVSGRGRGTIFLVDVKSRQVLWSVFEKPKNSSPHELDHTAERVVKQLKQDLSPKTK
jgi:hypothetical protein